MVNSNEMKERKITKRKLFFLIIGIIFYLFDVGSDIYLVIKYYYNGFMTYCTLTALPVIVSAVISSNYSWNMYAKIIEENKSTRHFDDSTKFRILRRLFLIIGFAPVFRNMEALTLAWKGNYCKDIHNKQTYLRSMIYEMKDGSFLRLFEAFLESGPQLVLQSYIFIVNKPLNPNVFTETEQQQCIAMFFSSVSMTFAIVSYLSSDREASESKREFTLWCYPILCLWRFFEVVSRVLVMGFLISLHPECVSMFIMHFWIVNSWTHSLETNLDDNRCSEKLLLGVILTFCYFIPVKEPTKDNFVIFYTGMFLENSALLALWYYSVSLEYYKNFKNPIIIAQVSFFCLSILCMSVYYKFFHPTIMNQSASKDSINIVETNDVSDKMDQEKLMPHPNNTLNEHVLSNGVPEIQIQNGRKIEENTGSKNNNSKDIVQKGRESKKFAYLKNASKNVLQSGRAFVKKIFSSNKVPEVCIDNGKNTEENGTPKE